MRIVATFSAARALARGRVGLVPTMGFFHEGHLSLMHEARRRCDTVLVSLFVNRLQFNDAADFERYPRRADRDAVLAAEAGVDLLFAPPPAEVYPEEPLTKVSVAGLTEIMEGPHRPGHFEGVAIVVTKLLAGLRPDVAFFGKKDAQQLALVRRLVHDLSLPAEIVGCSTVREADGLALSSRNVFLQPSDRPSALALSKGLLAAAAAVEKGERRGAVLESIAAGEGGWRRAPGPRQEIEFDYCRLASQDRVEPMAVLDRPAFLGVAGRVGAVRLIDNVAFDGDDLRPDLGVRLRGRSLLYGEV